MENQAQAEERRRYARYSRPHSRPRRDYDANRERRSDFRETLLMQCTVCAVIMAFVLVICIVNVPVTQNARNTIRDVVSKNSDVTNPSEMFTALNSLKRSVQSVFSGHSDYAEQNYIERPEQTPQVPEGAKSLSTQPVTGLPGEERIDENILSVINAKDDLYTKELEKLAAPLGEPTQTAAPGS